MSQQRKYSSKDLPEKIQRYCAYQERSHQEVREKLYEWGLHKQEVEQAISMLIERNFLNEERFAEAFVSGKFRIKSWGRSKIVRELKMKRVSPKCIEAGLKTIDEAEYTDTIDRLLTKKSREVLGKTDFERNGKIARYLIGKGFEPDLVWSRLRQLDA